MVYPEEEINVCASKSARSPLFGTRNSTGRDSYGVGGGRALVSHSNVYWERNDCADRRLHSREDGPKEMRSGDAQNQIE